MGWGDFFEILGTCFLMLIVGGFIYKGMTVALVRKINNEECRCRIFKTNFTAVNKLLGEGWYIE